MYKYRGNSTSSIAEQLGTQLTEFFQRHQINETAHQCKFIKRESDKIDGSNFLDVLMYNNFDSEQLSLNAIAGQFMDKFRLAISKQGVDFRFSEYSVNFMRMILDKLLRQIISKEPIMFCLKGFNSIRIKDSTAFQLPDDMKNEFPGSGGSGSKAMIRIQFEFDYLTGEVYDLSLHPFNCQDSIDAKETLPSICENDLIMRDLGYVSLDVLDKIEKKGAFYLNRPNYNTSIYEKENEKYVKLDFVKLQKKMERHQIMQIEKEVYLGEKKTVKTRLIIEYLPKGQIEERLRKAKKEATKKGRQLGKMYKSRVGLNLFITNAPAEVVPTKEVRSIYRLRWQVELIFKVWKSVGEIHKVKKMKVERFKTILYAKLIWITMNWSILWEIGKQIWQESKILLSLMKGYKTLKDRLYKQWQALMAGVLSMTIFIDEIYQMSPKNHRLEQRKGHLSSMEILTMVCLEKTV